MRDSLYNFPQLVRNSNRVRASGWKNTPGCDGRSYQVKEKSKGIFDLGKTDEGRRVVDGETSYGGQHHPKGPVLELDLAGIERRSEGEPREASIEGQWRSNVRARRVVSDGSSLEHAHRGAG
ncbi:hypothetical protein U1Q18_024574, partial [Sarracenia purpurea var. burkii]